MATRSWEKLLGGSRQGAGGSRRAAQVGQERNRHMVFGDLRGWIDHLRKEGELQEIDVEVDWNCELGTVARKAFGTGNGPALLFNNIKGYGEKARCSRVFTGGLSRYSRVAMMFGLPKSASITELVKAARTAYAGRDRKSTRLNSSHSQISYA